jgi:hypothetical protein
MCAQCLQTTGTLVASGTTLGVFYAGRMMWLGGRMAVRRRRGDAVDEPQELTGAAPGPTAPGLARIAGPSRRHAGTRPA